MSKKSSTGSLVITICALLFSVFLIFMSVTLKNSESDSKKSFNVVIDLANKEVSRLGDELKSKDDLLGQALSLEYGKSVIVVSDARVIEKQNNVVPTTDVYIMNGHGYDYKSIPFNLHSVEGFKAVIAVMEGAKSIKTVTPEYAEKQLLDISYELSYRLEYEALTNILFKDSKINEELKKAGYIAYMVFGMNTNPKSNSYDKSPLQKLVILERDWGER